MKDRTKTYQYFGGVSCRRNKRHWPANNSRSCQQSRRWQAPASPASLDAPPTKVDRCYRCRQHVTAQPQVHMDLVADCCRKFTTSSTSTRSPETIYYQIIRKLFRNTLNRRVKLYFHDRIQYLESRNTQHNTRHVLSPYRIYARVEMSNGEK